MNSSISRNGDSIGFAVPLPSSEGEGRFGVVTRLGRKWGYQLVPTQTGTGSAYAALYLGGGSPVVAYVSGGLAPSRESNVLYVRRELVAGRSWSNPVQIDADGVKEPQLLALGQSILLVWQQARAEHGTAKREAWLTRGRDNGTSWDAPTPLVTDAGLDPSISLVSLSSTSALALVELGGPYRRELRLMYIDEHRVDELFRDSIDAATRALLTRVGPDTFQAIWSRVRPGPDAAPIPESITRTFALACSGDPEGARPTHQDD